MEKDWADISCIYSGGASSPYHEHGKLIQSRSVIDPYMGMKRLLIHYGIIMIVGGLLSCLVHKRKSPYTRSIGASGVTCWLLGIYIMIAIFFKGLSALTSVARHFLS